MKGIVGIMVALVFVFATAATNVGGKDVFVNSKCTTCHSVKSQGIGTNKNDLSKIGLKGNADYFMKFQKGEIGNKKHPKKWTGSDGDLKSLAAWLASLK